MIILIENMLNYVMPNLINQLCITITISVRVCTYSTYLLKSYSIIIILRSDVQLRANKKRQNRTGEKENRIE